MHRSRRAVLLIATVLAWAACATSAHATGWLPGPTFGAGAITALGGVASDTAGGSTVAWVEDTYVRVEQEIVAVPTVYAQHVGPDGATGPRLRLGGGEGPSVVGTATGAVVTWAAPTGDNDDYDVRIGWIGADGAVSRVISVATASGLTVAPVIAAEPDGDTVVAWLDGAGTLRARRVAADGTPGPIVDLGAAVPILNEIGDVAISADGRARVVWQAPQESDSDMNAVWAARLDPAGALDGAATKLSGDSNAVGAQVASGAGGAVATWYEFEGDDLVSMRVKAARLPSADGVADTPVTVATGLTPILPVKGLVVTPDGTASIAYGDGSAEQLTASIWLRRLSADGTLGPATMLSGAPAIGTIDTAPVLAPGPDGSVVALWLRAAAGISLVSRTIAADGTPAAQSITVPGSGALTFQLPVLAANGVGDGITGWFVPDSAEEPEPGAPSPVTFHTALLDAAPPVVTATVPDSVQRGVDATFSVTATDRAGIASVAWQFGDGSGSDGATVRHAYARAGSYSVTATVTDNSGNEARVERTIVVTDPDVVVPPPGPGPGPGPGPVPTTPTPTPPGANPIARVAAGLKLTRVVRASGKVTVAGTLDRRASGRVTLSWAQKIGRRTIKRTATAKIANGRFAATIRLTGALARSRTTGTLTVTYGGDADTLTARATRTVRAPKRAVHRTRRT